MGAAGPHINSTRGLMFGEMEPKPTIDSSFTWLVISLAVGISVGSTFFLEKASNN